jgi:hypothetical protein
MSDEIQNAIIESARIEIERGGILDVWVFLDFGNRSQGFGGWALYLDKSCAHHKIAGVAGHHIFRIMQIAGASSWEGIVGKSVRCIATTEKIIALGHIIKDEWYYPEREFENAR